MFEYQRRAEARGEALPCAVVLGLHPLVSMGSLAYPAPDVGKFEVVGGLFGEPLQIAPAAAAKAPKRIIPSSPMFTTPARSLRTPPSAASTSGGAKSRIAFTSAPACLRPEA